MRPQGTVGYRIRQGNIVAYVARPFQASLIPFGSVHLIYDDGTEDDLYFDPSVVTVANTTIAAVTKQAAKNGYVLDGCVGLAASGVTGLSQTSYGQLLILRSPFASVSETLACIGNGFTGSFQVVSVGEFEDDDFGATWVFQGTVAEDATAGTHISSLTVTPGAGNEMQILYGNFIAGAGAANVTNVTIDDGTNLLARLITINTSLASGANFSFPNVALATTTGNPLAAAFPVTLSGAMRLQITTSTATVSLTHTFAVACRIKGALPTATLADSVGVPTLTTNTNAVF